MYNAETNFIISHKFLPTSTLQWKRHEQLVNFAEFKTDDVIMKQYAWNVGYNYTFKYMVIWLTSLLFFLCI